ncbi:MAG: hypothetical protein M3256_09360 [Actinomycetota bacterium]|nr:hypothetical protein [Actinomycetota bacterium]
MSSLLALSSVLLSVITGLLILQTTVGSSSRVQWSALAAIFATGSTFLYFRSHHLTKLYERLDGALLRLLACDAISVAKLVTRADMYLSFIFESERYITRSLWLGLLYSHFRYHLRRLTAGIESLVELVPADLRREHVPELNNLAGFGADVDRLDRQISRLADWSTQLNELSPHAVSETVRDAVKSTLFGPNLPNFDGWECLSLSDANGSIGHTAAAFRLSSRRDSLLHILISSEEPDTADSVTIPLTVTGGDDQDEVEFRVELRSTGLRPQSRAVPVRWSREMHRGLQEVQLTPVQTGTADLFVTTYIGTRLIQTSRLQCIVQADES